MWRTTLAAIGLFALSAIAIVAATHSSSEAAPRCDGPNPPARCPTATPFATQTPYPTHTPYPTFTPFPTSTPTATPPPQPGGGNEQVLAYDVIVQPSSGYTTLGTIDTNVCKGLIFYLAARSTDSVLSTVFNVQDGYGGFDHSAIFQADPAWKTWVSLKSAVSGLVTFSVRVPALDLYPARFVLEAHCEPSHP